MTSVGPTNQTPWVYVPGSWPPNPSRASITAAKTASVAQTMLRPQTEKEKAP